MTKQAEKKQVAVRLPLREKAELEAEAAERGVSRSEYIRGILRDRHREDDLAEDISELQEQLDAREQRVEDLEAQLRERHDIKNEIQDLPDKIRDADTYTERRQRKLDRASVLQRIRWKVTGVPVDGDDDLGE
jgi:predicted RNase H-like nuclease (RuvC/YqgF family)